MIKDQTSQESNPPAKEEPKDKPTTNRDGDDDPTDTSGSKTEFTGKSD